jgi:acetyltransferase-like isoleucine patch superfamily enzyme
VAISQNLHLIATDDLIIEDGVGIGPFAMISTCNHSYWDYDEYIVSQKLESAPIHIGEGALIGHCACVLPGVNIGKHCVIGSNVVVSKDIPDYTIVLPAKNRKATLSI